MIFPLDSEGTEFNPEKHNLLDNPPRPEMTSAGKFRKVRGSNDDDLVSRYVDTLKPDIGIAELEESPAPEEPAPTPLTGNEQLVVWGKMAQEAATILGAAIYSEDDGVLTLQKGSLRKAANLRNYETVEQLVAALHRVGL